MCLTMDSGELIFDWGDDLLDGDSVKSVMGLLDLV